MGGTRVFINNVNAGYALQHLERSHTEDNIEQNFICKQTALLWFEGANETIRFSFATNRFRIFR